MRHGGYKEAGSEQRVHLDHGRHSPLPMADCLRKHTTARTVTSRILSKGDLGKISPGTISQRKSWEEAGKEHGEEAVKEGQEGQLQTFAGLLNDCSRGRRQGPQGDVSEACLPHHRGTL